MKTIHLVCNAHIDPVWLWEREDGVAATLATFRSAAALAERYDYIFCHNEAMLYQWVEEHDAALFERIRALVRAGRWHIAGGWYLQPDCTMPAGETFARLIECGRAYFLEKFGVCPTTVVNYDAFGHSVGLVQIVKKFGYDSYLCCRPGKSAAFPDDRFTWVGLDGSAIEAARASGHYNSAMGVVENKIRPAVEKDGPETDVLLWGVGNHGGGPSAKDLETIAAMRAGGAPIRHSTPERFFAEAGSSVVTRTRSLNPCMPGCYASMARVKAAFRRLENRLFGAESISAHAAAVGLTPYPDEALDAAAHDLMFASFHDVLPGTGIRPVEEFGLRLLAHGEESADRARLRAFLALLRAEAPAAPGEYPAFAYNPHPYPIQTVVDVSFNLADQNYGDSFTDFTVTDGGRTIPSQSVRPHATLSLDWIKRVVFVAELAPGSMRRFSMTPVIRPGMPRPDQPDGDAFVFQNEAMRAGIDLRTGLLTRYDVHGVPMIGGPALSLAVYRDNADPWAMSPKQQESIGAYEGAFRLMTAEESALHAGGHVGALAPVRVVEQGDVLTEVEAVFAYGASSARVVYRFYRTGAAFDVAVHLHNREADRVIRLRVPAAFSGALNADTAYGYESVPQNAQEWPMQKWVCLSGEAAELAIANDASYSVRAEKDTVEIVLARSAAHAAHPIHDRPLLPENRYTARIDQGELAARFRVSGGPAGGVLPGINRAAFVFNTPVFALCAFPGGPAAQAPEPLVALSGGATVVMASLRRVRGRFLVRLHNNHASPTDATLRCPLWNLELSLRFGPFEIKTLTVSAEGIQECVGMMTD